MGHSIISMNSSVLRRSASIPRVSTTRQSWLTWETIILGRAKGQVLVQTMYIPALRKKNGVEVVLWDTGTDTNYVRLEQAEKQRFPYRMETAMVTTVGGEVQRKTLPVYRCKIKDQRGRILTF